MIMQTLNFIHWANQEKRAVGIGVTGQIFSNKNIDLHQE